MSHSRRPFPIADTPKRASRTRHQVRIIGGQWKRTPLDVPDVQGLRPTPDRVRETVFNWLDTRLGRSWTGVRCLDLFAGSGALGFEAASRGAVDVVMVESQGSVVKQLESVKEKLHATQVQVVRGDAKNWVQQERSRLSVHHKRFRIIFLDPPYQQEWLPSILPMCRDILTEDGMVYVEAEYSLTRQPSPDWLQGWDVVRHDRAGQVFYHLLVRLPFLE